jgi:hypothetical protein
MTRRPINRYGDPSYIFRTLRRKDKRPKIDLLHATRNTTIRIRVLAPSDSHFNPYLPTWPKISIFLPNSMIVERLAFLAREYFYFYRSGSLWTAAAFPEPLSATILTGSTASTSQGIMQGEGTLGNTLFGPDRSLVLNSTIASIFYRGMYFLILIHSLWAFLYSCIYVCIARVR